MTDQHQRTVTTVALLAVVVTLYGGWVGGWFASAKLFFGVARIECEASDPANCPTNLEKLRFVLTAIPLARRVSVATGAPVSAIVAQAGHETAFGQSYLWRNFNNGFGIKCSGTFTSCVSRWDHEYLNGQRSGWVSKFRAYQDPAGSFFDYASFLKVNPRYRAAWANRKSGGAFVREVAAAGYATDPLYAAKVTRIIRALQLERFDLKPEQWALSGGYCAPSDRAAGWCP